MGLGAASIVAASLMGGTAVLAQDELIVGVSSGGDFGPMLLYGEGGSAVEVVADTALELPPLKFRSESILIIISQHLNFKVIRHAMRGKGMS